VARGEERDAEPRPRSGGASRRGDFEGSVWFRAAIGRRKNAEARWLLPMICRRGGIDKHAIGAIRILESTTEFEISANAAEAFAAMVSRPDKDDNIRIEAIGEAPRHAPEFVEPSHAKPSPERGRHRHDERASKPTRPFPGAEADQAAPRAFKPPRGVKPARAYDPLRDDKPRRDREPDAHPSPRPGKAHHGKPHPGKPRPAQSDLAGKPKPPRGHAGGSGRKKKNLKKQPKKTQRWY
jgi:ATP-dependent RNA helicase DeaD